MTQPSIPVLALWLETGKVAKWFRLNRKTWQCLSAAVSWKCFEPFVVAFFGRFPNKGLQCRMFMYGIAWSLVSIAKAPLRDSSTDLRSCMSGRFRGWSPRLMQMHQCLPTLHLCLSCICRHSLVHLQAEHLSQNWFSIVLFVNNSGNLGNLDRWSIANSQRDFCGFTCNSLRAL